MPEHIRYRNDRYRALRLEKSENGQQGPSPDWRSILRGTLNGVNRVFTRHGKLEAIRDSNLELIFIHSIFFEISRVVASFVIFVAIN